LEKDYKIIKEKCVSREFEIVTDIESAFDSFIKRDVSSYDKFLENEKNQLIEIFDKCDHKNLRTLKNIIFDFRKFCDEIKTIHKDGVEKIPENKRKILQNNYFMLSFGLFSGIIDKNDINEKVLFDETSVSIASSRLNKNGKENNSKEGYLMDLYWNLEGVKKDDRFLSYILWEDWFKRGYFYKENIESFIASSSFVFEEEKCDPSWYKLWYWRDLKDDEIDSVYKEVLKDLEDGKYLFAPHVLHTSGILFASSKRGLIKESITELKDKMAEYIRKNGERFEYILPISFMMENEAWGGLGYASKDTEEFKEIKKIIYEQLVMVADKEARKWVPELFKIFEKNPQELYKKLIIDEERKGYARIPIFKKDDVEKVFKIVLGSKSNDKNAIFHSLEERIKMFNGNPEFEEERMFYKELMNKVSSYINENKGKVSACVLDQICGSEIKKILRNER
jgi:hypothetical protein